MRRAIDWVIVAAVLIFAVVTIGRAKAYDSHVDELKDPRQSRPHDATVLCDHLPAAPALSQTDFADNLIVEGNPAKNISHEPKL